MQQILINTCQADDYVIACINIYNVNLILAHIPKNVNQGMVERRQNERDELWL